MAATPTAAESSTEALQQKLQELGYLNPPKIAGEDCEYTVNSHVPNKKPFRGYWLEGMIHLLIQFVYDNDCVAAEHEETARFVELFSIHEDKLPNEEALVTVNTKEGDVDLNFSNIIAIAGDFYTNKEGYEVSIKATFMAVVDVCLYFGASSYDVLGLSSLSAK